MPEEKEPKYIEYISGSCITKYWIYNEEKKCIAYNTITQNRLVNKENDIYTNKQ